MKKIEKYTYSMNGSSLEEAKHGLINQVDVKIIHRVGLLQGICSKIGKSTLWVVDCRWCGSKGLNSVWSDED